MLFKSHQAVSSLFKPDSLSLDFVIPAEAGIQAFKTFFSTMMRRFMDGLHLSKDLFGRFPDGPFPAVFAVSIPGFYRHPNKIYSPVPTKKISVVFIVSEGIHIEKRINRIFHIACKGGSSINQNHQKQVISGE